MDFFARQDHSRRSTRHLLVAFGTAFMLVALASTAAVAVVLGVLNERSAPRAVNGDVAGLALEHLPLLGGILAGTLGLMVLASLFRTASIARGGAQVARMLGGTEVTSASTDPLHARLVNVVEEMAIASGLPVPEIFVLEQEAGINAFAAGLEHADAAVAVTRGALEQLTRAELQGVVAHEFSHVLNGDMRLNQRLIGLSFGILVLSLLGRWLLHSARFAVRSRNRGLPVALFVGLMLVVIGGIGVLLTRLIKAAVSRQRETLADASAVQFTREPSALAGALKKIGGFTAKLESIESEEVSHMLFGSAGQPFARWLATHPPLVERIQALEPSFRPGDYPAPHPPGTAVDETAEAGAAGLAGAPAGAGTGAEDPIGRAGTIESAAGGALRRAIPESLYTAAQGRDTCLLLVVALAVSPDASAAERQRRLVEARLGETRARRCLTLRGELEALEPELRLPLVELALPALRKRPREQLEFLTDLVAELGDLDETPRLFDHLLLLLLGTYLHPEPRGPIGAAREPRLSEQAALESLFTSVAAYGHSDPDAAAAAYAAGLAALGRESAAEPARFADLAALRVPSRLDPALARLARLPARAKRGVLTGLLALIRHDNELRTNELELLRVIAATLGCPLPPAAPRLPVT